MSLQIWTKIKNEKPRKTNGQSFEKLSNFCLKSFKSTYLSCVAMHSLSYRVSAAYFTKRHFLPEMRCFCTRRRSSVLLPANMGPMIISMRPLNDGLSWSLNAIFSLRESYSSVKYWSTLLDFTMPSESIGISSGVWNSLGCLSWTFIGNKLYRSLI